MTSHRLGITIANAEGNDLRPAGTHLRWFFPRSTGFPLGGCEIFRIPYEDWRDMLQPGILLQEADLRFTSGGHGQELGTANWSGRDRRLQVHQDLNLVFRQATRFAPDGDNLRLVDAGNAGHLLLQFRTPVIYIRLEMSLPVTPHDFRGSVTGFYRSARLFEAPVREIIEIDQPGITDLLIPLTFMRLMRIAFVREQDLFTAVQAKKLGTHVASLPLPHTAGEAYAKLQPELGSGIKNRMLTASNMNAVEARYTPSHVASLVKYLNSSVANPELTVTAPGSVGQERFPVKVLDHLNLAALDPNIARMLVSYWVDQTPGDYLYMVSATYARGKSSTIRYGFGFTKNAADAPQIAQKITAYQLPGIDYRDSKAHGRIGLIWDRESGDYRDPSKPVFVDVERGMGSKTENLTKESPHLIGSSSSICFRDRVPVHNKVQYQVTPIDIFGRSDNSSLSNPLEIRDLEAPVPPKRIRAIVKQNGFPWTQPAQRKEPDILQGTVLVTAEFGEAQRRASPDTKEIKWLWRPGPLPDSAVDPGNWSLLATEKLLPHLEAKVVWKPNSAPLTFHLPVKEVRSIGSVDSQHLSERLDANYNSASDLAPGPFHAGSDLLELILDQPLLEPGLFDDYIIESANGPVIVIGTHAGIAARQDKGDFQRSARLVVQKSAAANAIQPGDTITLHNPFNKSESQIQDLLRNATANQEEMPTPLVRVIMQTSLDSVHAQTSGGEVAIDYHYLILPGPDSPTDRIKPVDASVTDASKRQSVIVGRLVSSVQSDPSSSTFMLRLQPADFLRVLLISKFNQQITTAARFHAPNLLAQKSIGLNGAGGDIQISMPLSKRYTSLYLTAITVDAHNKQSTQVATPFETRIVNPPPVVTPAAPYPYDGDHDMPFGEPSLPDHHGRSTVHIEWDAIDLQGAAIDGVRYELARALDSSIIGRDRDHWRRGGPEEHFAALSIKAQPAISGWPIPGPIAEDRGTFRVHVKDPDQELIAKLAGIKGRIELTHSFPHPHNPGDPNKNIEERHTHRLLKVAASTTEPKELALICQPFRPMDELLSGKIAGNVFQIHAEPDYAAVFGSEDKLRQLADLRFSKGDLEGEGRNESAFGIVTGVPISGTDFVDAIPGVGRSRFLYKVRAVFPGEVRSAWSSASVAFRQIDLSAPDIPEVISIRREAAVLTATLSRPSGLWLRGVRLLSAPDESKRVEIVTYAFEPRSGELPLQPAPLRTAGKLLDLRRILPAARGRLGAEAKLDGVYEAGIDQNAPPLDENMLNMQYRNLGDIIELARPHSFDPPVVLQISANSAVEWLSHIEEYVEISIALQTISKGDLLVQTVKEITRPGSSTIMLYSEPIRLGGMS